MKKCHAFYQIALPVYLRHYLSKGNPQLNAWGYRFLLDESFTDIIFWEVKACFRGWVICELQILFLNSFIWLRSQNCKLALGKYRIVFCLILKRIFNLVSSRRFLNHLKFLPVVLSPLLLNQSELDGLTLSSPISSWPWQGLAVELKTVMDLNSFNS